MWERFAGAACYLLIGMVVLYPFLAFGNWLWKKGAKRNGLGCLASTLVILAAWAMIPLMPESHDVPLCYMSLIPIGLAGCGLVGWSICFCVLVPLMAKREERRSGSDYNGMAAVQEDEPSQQRLAAERDALP